MPQPSEREIEVFNAALELPAAERAAYLDRVCAGDAAFRRRVEELLNAGEEAGTFLEPPAANPPGPGETIAVAVVPAEKPGDRIGRYKLLQQIGEGGCGVVYLAEQEEPVRRKVALKVIKAGMDTKGVIARFEAERQALALMDHPNIAKVLDAGATDKGRPYFVMELVRGVKITDYCDQNNLSTQERLDLFLQVCRAIQHAHQKGIIHRDIKPSNVLVAMNDGVPLPKVIDFGIAKATHGKLTDQTLFTAFEQFMGTPAYMSPEQAELSVLDIDTRSDIYSLGVLLYELLTGKTPFDAQELFKAGLDEMRRQIREKEPARPSTKLSTMMDADLTAVAGHRQAPPLKLIHLVRGDLDWIVMKCLEKDRTRRYDTANGLAMDLQRHLKNEPVAAGPPSAGYRVRKFVRRHRVGVLAGSLVLLALLAGIVGTTLSLLEALRQKREALRQGAIARNTTGFLTGMFESIDPAEAKLRDITVREVLDNAAGNLGSAFPNQPLTELPIRETMADIYEKLGRYDEGLTNAQAALRLARIAHGDKDDPDVVGAMKSLGECQGLAGLLDDALATSQQALAMAKRLNPGPHPAAAQALSVIGECLRALGRPAEALPQYQASLDMWRLLKSDTTNVAVNLHAIAVCLDSLGHSQEALPKHVEALALWRRSHPEDDPTTASMLSEQGRCLDWLGNPSEALAKHQEALSMRRRIYKGDHDKVAESLKNIGYTLASLGRPNEALPYYEEALSISQRVYKGDHPNIAFSLNNVARCLDDLGRLAEALSKYQEILAMDQRLYRADHPEVARVYNDIGKCLQNLRRPAEALTNYMAALEMTRRIYKQDHPIPAQIMMHVIDCQIDLGRIDDAARTAQEAAGLFQRLVAAQPNNKNLRFHWATTLQKLGDLLAASGQSAAATPIRQQGLNLVEALLGVDPANQDAAKLRLGFRAELGLEKVDVVIDAIGPNGQAHQIGLRPGDAMVSYAGHPLISASELQIWTHSTSGPALALQIKRNGALLDFTVKEGPLGMRTVDRPAAK